MDSSLPLLIASITPVETIIDMLKKDIEKYESAITSEEKEKHLHSVQFMCMLMSTKMVAPDLDAALKVEKDLKKFEETREFLDPDKNVN